MERRTRRAARKHNMHQATNSMHPLFVSPLVPERFKVVKQRVHVERMSAEQTICVDFVPQCCRFSVEALSTQCRASVGATAPPSKGGKTFDLAIWDA